jgi:hypothetical protein
MASKFSGLRDVREPAIQRASEPRTQQTEEPRTQNTETAEPKKPGRPKNGKRSNPGYVQVSAYIPRHVYLAAKHKMLDEGNREFSDVVREFITDYAREYIK